MIRNSGFLSIAAALTLSISACESSTGPEEGGLEVLLTSEAGAAASTMLSPSFSISADHQTGMGPIELSDVESIVVDITDVLVLPATEADELEDEEGTGWVSLDGGPFNDIDLKSLTTVTTLGTLPADAGISEVVAVRLVFGDAEIKFAGHDPEPLFVPSGKVTIATPTLATDGTTLELTFLQAASVKKVIRTGTGYLMPPVFDIEVEAGS